MQRVLMLNGKVHLNPCALSIRLWIIIIIIIIIIAGTLCKVTKDNIASYKTPC